MLDPKRKIKICLIFAIIVLFVNVFMLVSDIYNDVLIFWLSLDILYIVCGAVSIVGFGIFNAKPMNFAIKHKKLFVTIVCFACVCSLILGFVALLTLYDIYTPRVKIVNDNTIETSGTIIPTAEELTARIKLLDEMLKNNFITEEEYQKLKKDILDEIIGK